MAFFQNYRVNTKKVVNESILEEMAHFYLGCDTTYEGAMNINNKNTNKYAIQLTTPKKKSNKRSPTLPILLYDS